MGVIQAVRTGWYTFKPARQALGWRRRRDESGGGAMLDLGLSLVDLALWLLDWPDPCHVSASFGPIDRGATAVEDSGVALITCEGGASLFVDVSWHYVGAAERNWFELVGSAGSATIGPLAVFKEMQGLPVDVTPRGTSERTSIFNAAYQSQWAHLGALIRGEVEPNDLREQIVLHRVIEGIYRSAEAGQPVTL